MKANASQMPSLNDRMHCEKYHADIPVSTCIARQNGVAEHFGQGRIEDPGCKICEQGSRIMETYGGKKVAEEKTEEKKEVKEERLCKHVASGDKPLYAKGMCRRCYSNDRYRNKHSLAAGSKAKTGDAKDAKTDVPEPESPPARGPTEELMIDFSNCPELKDKLGEAAEDDIRTIEAQALYYIKCAVLSHKGTWRCYEANDRRTKKGM